MTNYFRIPCSPCTRQMDWTNSSLWMCGNTFNESHSVWSGFMNRATAGSKVFQTFQFTRLQFVNLDPNDIRSIYTTIKIAAN